MWRKVFRNFYGSNVAFYNRHNHKRGIQSHAPTHSDDCCRTFSARHQKINASRFTGILCACRWRWMGCHRQFVLQFVFIARHVVARSVWKTEKNTSTKTKHVCLLKMWLTWAAGNKLPCFLDDGMVFMGEMHHSTLICLIYYPERTPRRTRMICYGEHEALIAHCCPEWWGRG